MDTYQKSYILFQNSVLFKLISGRRCSVQQANVMSKKRIGRAASQPSVLL